MVEYKEIHRAPGYLAGSDGSIIGRSGKVLRQGRTPGGYPMFRASRPGLKKPASVSSHVAICEAWHGPRPTDLHEVAHENGIKIDNRPVNLSWKTRSENMMDKLRHGTHNRGANHYKTKISDDDVLKIRASTESNVALAAIYGVSDAHICLIRHGKRRAHVTEKKAIR